MMVRESLTMIETCYVGERIYLAVTTDQRQMVYRNLSCPGRFPTDVRTATTETTINRTTTTPEQPSPR